MDRGLIAGIAAGLALLALPARADVTVARELQPAQMTHAGAITALNGGESLVPSDRVRTGEGGRVELRLPRGASLKLAGNAAVELHNTDESQGIARLTLKQGAAEAAAGDADLRINTDSLRLRVKDASVWLEQADSGQTLCLLKGRVEFSTAAGAPETLQTPGVCLLFQDGQRLTLTPDADTLARKRAHTAFPGLFSSATP